MRTIQVTPQQLHAAREAGQTVQFGGEEFALVGDDYVLVELLGQVVEADAGKANKVLPEDDFFDNVIVRRAKARQNGEKRSPLNTRQRKLLGRHIREYAQVSKVRGLDGYRTGEGWVRACELMAAKLAKGEPEASAALSTVRALAKQLS